MQNSYKFVVHKDNEDTACICITNGGEFDGVIYRYGAVTIPEEFDDQGNLPFRFEFDIIDNYGIPKDNFNEDFFNLIGDILVDIIDTQVEDTETEVDEID